MNKKRGSAKMMLMMKKKMERRMAMVLEIWDVEGLTTVSSLVRNIYYLEVKENFHLKLFCQRISIPF